MKLRILTNLLSPMLVKYRYRNKKDPFFLFTKMRIKSKLFDSEVSKGNILLLPIRVSPTSNVFEGIVGYALKLRGYSVSALMCGQNLKKCDNINQRRSFSLACSLCKHEQKRFCKAYSINSINYTEGILSTKQKELSKISIATPLSDIFSFVYDNVSIGKYVEGGVSRYLLTSNIDLEDNERIIREFFYTSLMTVEATRYAINCLKPKFIIASHGIYSTWGAALETCITDGFPIIIWGRGYVGKGNMQASHNASYLFDSINETSESWENSIIDEKIRLELDSYFTNKQKSTSKVDHVNYYNGINDEQVDIFSSLNLERNRRRIGIYPNIPWDGKMFSATEDFPDMNAFVRAIIEWSEENPDVDLIIRAHPAEVYNKGNESLESFLDVIQMECVELPSNFRYIEPKSAITSYQLSSICDAALMYSSTLALEFAYFNHPVIQVGLNNISNKKLIFDAPKKQIMFDYLDKATNGTLVVDTAMKERILKYASYWINNRHFPEELVNLSNLTFEGYSFESCSDLQPGNFRTLDWFIEKCMNGKPFHWNLND